MPLFLSSHGMPSRTVIEAGYIKLAKGKKAYDISSDIKDIAAAADGGGASSSPHLLPCYRFPFDTTGEGGAPTSYRCSQGNCGHFTHFFPVSSTATRVLLSLFPWTVLGCAILIF